MFGHFPIEIPFETEKKSELSFFWVTMLNSYIFVFRKQNATRNCNLLFEFLYFGFLDPPNALAHASFKLRLV